MSNKEQGFEQWSDAVMIPIDGLMLTDWNANEMADEEFAALIDEVDNGGFDEPIQVVPIKAGVNKGKYLVIGGEHRYKSAVACSFDKVPCVIKKHLDPDNKAGLMLWSVQRNNIRGKLNAEKYMKIQNAITDRLGISKKVAQNRMMIRQDMAESLNKYRQRDDEKKKSRDNKTGDNKSKTNNTYDTDGAKDRAKTLSDRKKLLNNLKTFQQDVLLESGDTIEQGYLYFGQSGKSHLIVEESTELYGLVRKMVQVCKNNSDKINDFLESAIRKEIPKWE